MVNHKCCAMTSLVRDLFERKWAQVFAEEQQVLAHVEQLKSLRATLPQTTNVIGEIKHLEHQIAKIGRVDSTVFLLNATPYLNKERELNAILANPALSNTDRKCVHAKLNSLIADWKKEFLADAIAQQDKSHKRRKGSSRSRVRHRKKRHASVFDTKLAASMPFDCDDTGIDPGDQKDPVDDDEENDNDGAVDPKYAYDRGGEDDQKDSMTHAERYMKQFTYKRIGHFREFLRQLQGKCVARMKEVDEGVMLEFTRSNVPPERITPLKVRSKLKKLRLSDYYDQATSICCALNKQYKPIVIPPEREAKLCEMFFMLEPVYEEIKPTVRPDRKNFMSYPTATYKMCEILGWEEYLPHIFLLISLKLQIEQDEYWRKCCEKLGWPFVPTVGNIAKGSTNRKRKRE